MGIRLLVGLKPIHPKPEMKIANHAWHTSAPTNFSFPSGIYVQTIKHNTILVLYPF
ncbi:hypothetical protein GGR42_002747 [Saonia flava]|uniref:Uncharacterized protein n=1 Tax=Saonia flava TaxID=523696 RepID=A0A846QTG3_9FLAO|nr:hypothetical protein [Saonia flava]NJB72256.1 hypothetical protein [Saonia flava]